MNLQKSSCARTASVLLQQAFGPAANSNLVAWAPGRVNLIGEHIDYHLLPVLPMAIGRGVALVFRPNDVALIRAVSTGAYSKVEIGLGEQQPGAQGDWSNYVKAAVLAIQQRWVIHRGLDAAAASDLPQAAGLSSSTALMTAFALALLRVNGIIPTFKELMSVLPEGEQFVGTRGGSMDHAAILAGEADHALYLRFTPLDVEPVPVPKHWAFLVAHSLETAEKSGLMRERYNALRVAGLAALAKQGYGSFHEAVPHGFGSSTDPVYRHVVSEAQRVEAARAAMLAQDLSDFGMQLRESHASMRDRLGISTPAIDRLVGLALDSGAAGARLTGAGFGGCVLAVCHIAELATVQAALSAFYVGRPTTFPADQHPAGQHLFVVQPSGGALACE